MMAQNEPKRHAGRCGTVAAWLAYVSEIIAGRFCGVVCGTVQDGYVKSLIMLREGCGTVRDRKPPIPPCVRKRPRSRETRRWHSALLVR